MGRALLDSGMSQHYHASYRTFEVLHEAALLYHGALDCHSR